MLSHSTDKLSRRTLLCFRKILLSKTFMDKKGEGSIAIFVKSLLSHSTDIIRRGTLLCFTKLLVSKSFFCIRGEYHDLQSKTCCLTLPKNLVGEAFYVLEKLWYRNFLWIKSEKGVSPFFVKSLLSHSAGKNRRSLLFLENFLYRKNLHPEGNLTIFIRQFVVSQYRKISGNTSVFQKNSGIGKRFG